MDMFDKMLVKFVDNTLVTLATESKADRKLAEKAFKKFQKHQSEKSVHELKEAIDIRAANRKKRFELIKQMVNSIPG
jgi:hypothetical protein